MSRNLPNWLESFEKFTETISAPAIFKRWTGLSLLAAALERKVWIVTDQGELYPNLYVFLVAPPGVGKTVLTSLSWRSLKNLSEHKIASSSITRATIIEELADANRFKSTPQGAVSFNSLYICSNELGTLLPAYELEFMSKLTEIYDGHSYSEKRRNSKHNADIKKPQINMLAATQPGYLSGMLPEVAWEQGFLSRTILVYSGEVVRKSLFTKTEQDTSLWENVIKDLRRIGQTYGEMRFTQEAMDLIDGFHISGHTHTDLMHPKMQHYNTRRPLHLLKLMMLASVSESDELVITGDHYRTGLDWLVEAEHTMPEIFKAMQTGGDSAVIKEAWYFVFRTQAETQKPVPESRLIAFLGQRAPSEKVRWLIDIMEKMKLLKMEFTDEKCYRANGNPNVT